MITVYIVLDNESKVYGVRYEMSDAETLQQESQEHLEFSGSRNRVRIESHIIK